MNLGRMFVLMGIVATVGFVADHLPAAEKPAKRAEQATGQWSVRFPNHARLVYDADARTCFCEGSLQDAYDGVVASMKSSLDNCERRLYGQKQWDELPFTYGGNDENRKAEDNSPGSQHAH